MAAAQTDRIHTLELVGAFALVYVIWGSTYLAIRFVVEALPPFLTAGIRFLVAGTLLFGWLWIRGIPMPTLSNWRAAAVAGALLLLGGNGGVVWAEQTVPSGVAALILATIPLWMVLAHWVQPGGEKPSVRTMVGIAIGLVGIILLVNPFAGAGEFQVHPAGAIALALATISWSVGSVYARTADLPDSGLMATAIEMLTGGFFLVLTGTLAGEWPRLTMDSVTTKSLLALGYLIVFGSLIAFSAYVWLLKNATPAKVSTYAYVNPVIAVFLGWLLAGETLNSRIVLSAAIIVFAVFLITISRKRIRSA